jgi:hypothetical protein
MDTNLMSDFPNPSAWADTPAQLETKRRVNKLVDNRYLLENVQGRSGRATLLRLAHMVNNLHLEADRLKEVYDTTKNPKDRQRWHKAQNRVLPLEGVVENVLSNEALEDVLREIEKTPAKDKAKIKRLSNVAQVLMSELPSNYSRSSYSLEGPTPKELYSSKVPQPQVSNRSPQASKAPALSRVAPYARTAARAGGAALMPLLAAGAINDTKEHWTPENFAYGASSLNPLGENFNLKPWLETARTAAGLAEATPDMFDEAGNPAFWKALPGEILNSGLHTGAEMGKSIGRFGRDAGKGLADAMSRQGEEAKLKRPPQSASYDTIGQTKAYH